MIKIKATIQHVGDNPKRKKDVLELYKDIKNCLKEKDWNVKGELKKTAFVITFKKLENDVVIE